MKKLSFGFRLSGFLAVLSLLLPNLLSLLWVPEQGAPRMDAPLAVDIVENFLRAIMIASLVFLVTKKGAPKHLFSAEGLLIAYYVFWALYYLGVSHALLLLGMAVIPVLYCIEISRWMGNDIALTAAVLFGVVHIGNTAFILFR